MDLPGHQQPFLKWFGPRTKFLAQGPFGPKFKNFQFSHKTPNYGCLWTHLDRSINIWGNLDPGAKFWVQGPIDPKLKNCNFLTKPRIMSVSRLAWTPAIIFKVIWIRGKIFGPTANSKICNFCTEKKIFLAPNLKKCNFLTKPHNMGVYGLTWTQAIMFEVIWTLLPNFRSKGPLAKNKIN